MLPIEEVFIVLSTSAVSNGFYGRYFKCLPLCLCVYDVVCKINIMGVKRCDMKLVIYNDINFELVPFFPTTPVD